MTVSNGPFGAGETAPGAPSAVADRAFQSSALSTIQDWRAPTLLINGALDSAARREAGRDLEATIPGARHIELAGAGHLAALDDPLAYARAVASFCAGLPA